MEDTTQNKSVIIITGMHRSGTSLTASLLQSAGIQIGDRLMGQNKGNDKGHFEDLDFVEFHQDVLQSQGICAAGWTNNSSIQVQQQYLAAAQNLILARQNQTMWGWKDPRTTLFLDFWHQLISDAKFVFIFRSPWEVVDSLFRRGDVIFGTNPNFALQQWCQYNQTILDFQQQYPKQSVLLEVESIIQHPEAVVNLLKQKFQLDLRSPKSLYDPNLFHIDSNIQYRQALINKFFPESVELYAQLQEKADFDCSSHLENQQGNSIYKSWILQDWHDIKKIKAQEKLTQKELTQTQQQLESIQREQAQTEHQRNLIAVELEQVRHELERTSKAEIQTPQQQKELQIAQMQAEQFKQLVVAMESSKFWKLRKWWINIKQQLKLNAVDTVYQNYLLNPKRTIEPRNTFGNSFTEIDPEVPLSDDPIYQRWLQLNYPRTNELKKLKEACTKWTHQPLISIIVPVYNPDENFLRQAITSVQAQVYPNWELCLADDCSTKSYVRQVLEEYADQDDRIKVTFRTENGHICHTSNSAMDIATGEYIALLDHDDLLTPHALAKVVELVNKHPEADFIYSDEDKVDHNNIYQSPFFKPDWCPDSFLARMYTCHLGVYRRSLVSRVGNFRVGFEGSQDYDLVLRVTEKTDNIFHIPDILYHWRIHKQSTASDSQAKPYAANAAKKAITEAIERRGEPGKITTKSSYPGVYRIRYQIKEPKLVSIIIPTKDLADSLDVCLKSIFTHTTYPNYEVIVVDNNSSEAKTAKCFSNWKKKEPQRFRTIPYHVPFNYSQINNYAVSQTQGEYLLFLNNDIEVITKGWVTAMVEQSQRKSIGAVGSLLLYPDDTIQHAGVVVGLGGVAGHSHKHLHISQPGYMFQVVSINNYSAVTGACMMCRREVFEEVQGFEEYLAIAFNDVDFCLKIATAGYNNIYLPHVVLYHYESKSRGYEDTPKKQARFAKEVNYMKQKWQSICLHDPCYNPNLTKNHENYTINV